MITTYKIEGKRW